MSYEVEVTNEGNVPSGTYSFTDTLPAGMSFVSASDGGTASGQVVTWADMPSLDPDASKVVTVTASLDDASPGTYRNWVQITADSADTYSTPDELVVDADSEPGNGEQGEDDDDPVEITVVAVPVPPGPGDSVPPGGSGGTGTGSDGGGGGGGLAFTGGDFAGLTWLGLGTLLAGLVAVLGSFWLRGRRYRPRHGRA